MLLDAAGAATVSAPGGAGHALQFRDHVLLKKDFKVRKLCSATDSLCQQHAMPTVFAVAAA